MGHGAHAYFASTIASAATRSVQVDLGRSWAHQALDIPARSNTTLYVLCSASDGGTFRRIYNSASRAGAETLFQIASATTNAIVPIPGGCRFIKIESQDAFADGLSFNVIVSDQANRNG